MIINQYDLGGYHPWRKPKPAQQVTSVVVPRGSAVNWSQGAHPYKASVEFWIAAFNAIGGQPANSAAALEYLVTQVEELTSNPDIPIYIQWAATAQTGLLNTPTPADGWYLCDDFEPDRSSFLPGGLVKCKMNVTKVANHPARYGFAQLGGILNSPGVAYSNATNAYAQCLRSLPIGSSTLGAWAVRTGAEGSLPIQPWVQPGSVQDINPVPFAFSSTYSNWWTGRVRVYDTINTTSNPIPTAAGVYVNSNWVEVAGVDHDFKGDLVITNGLILVLIQTSTTLQTCNPYLWANNQWMNPGFIANYDQNGQTAMSCIGYQLIRTNLEVAEVILNMTSSIAHVAYIRIRVERGSYTLRFEITPVTYTALYVFAFFGAWPGNTTMGACNIGVKDGSLTAEQGSSLVPADQGWGLAWSKTQGTTFPFIVGWHSYIQGTAVTYIGGAAAYIYESTQIPAGKTVQYGFSMVPFANLPNLQAEAESGVYTGSIATAADVSASGGNVAKILAGTGYPATNVIFGTAWAPPAGWYRAWFRCKVSSLVGAVNLWRLAVTDTTLGVPNNYMVSADYSPSSFGTAGAWQWIPLGPTGNFQPAGSGHTLQFEVQLLNGSPTVDFSCDQAVLVPAVQAAAATGGLDLWGQFIYERDLLWAMGY